MRIVRLKPGNVNIFEYAIARKCAQLRELQLAQTLRPDEATLLAITEQRVGTYEQRDTANVQVATEN